MKNLLKIALFSVIFTHMVIVILFVASFFFLPFSAPWYVATPLMVFIVFFTTSDVNCQLTNLENTIRKKLNMPEINGFVGHYIYKYIMIIPNHFRDKTIS